MTTSGESQKEWLQRQLATLKGAFWEFRNGGEDSAWVAAKWITEHEDEVGRARVEGTIDTMIKKCGSFPAFSEWEQYIPTTWPPKEVSRCPKCIGSDGWEMIDVPGKKLPYARRCKHEAS